MTSPIELRHRIKRFLRFSKQELSTIVIATLIMGFIFSFRDWGDTTFNLSMGLTHLILTVLIVFVSIIFKLTCQKLYALSTGYKAEFKVWWAGLIIALVFAFITKGIVPLVLTGTIVTSFMVKQRLGEFRYAHNYEENAMAAQWGVYGALIMAMIFAIGLLYFPESYFFNMGVFFNLVMAASALIPIPQLDGLTIIWGSKLYYIIGITLSLLSPLLLLSYKINLVPQKVGLITAIVIGSISGIIYMLVMSEK
jgi:hypothetical protein